MTDSARLMIAARLRPAPATSCVDDARTASSTTRPPVWSSMAGPTPGRVEQHARYWPSNRVARWIVTDGRLTNRPHGVLMALRPANEIAVDTVPADVGETSPGEQRLAAL